MITTSSVSLKNLDPTILASLAPCVWVLPSLGGDQPEEQQSTAQLSGPNVPATPTMAVEIDRKNELWIEFQSLVEQWRSERGAISTVAEMAMLPSYQRIIGMGDDAIRFILAQLKSEGDAPDHWFWALAALVRHVNPVPQQSRGRMSEMANAWIKWGQEQGYV